MLPDYDFTDGVRGKYAERYAQERRAPGRVDPQVSRWSVDSQTESARETFTPETDHGGGDGPEGSVRYLNWIYDPDPDDTEFISEMVFLIRTADGATQVEHDRHHLGLFPESTWLELLRRTGFEEAVQSCAYPGADACRSFVGVRPRSAAT